ncbi:cell division protein FtsQ/DivIB [Shimia biformata]|uniref:cell division protein FtsQ/DivIB n=1 Tax=Shimia biformata TaxID=1294299 RepID=UPI0019512B67|nr:cell division protein FtsQ/DivIB [Shimia biformata]
MQPIKPQPCDPAPSRLAYRYQRLMLTPLFRLTLRVFLPFLLSLAVAGIYLSDADRRDQLAMAVGDLRNSIQTRPEFMVNVMAIDGASRTIAEDIREVTPIDFPISSFDLDLELIQQTVAELPAVARATVRIKPGGILQVSVTERDPVMLWRSRQGLATVDKAGYVVRPVNSRSARADLPLIAGDGAEERVDEALALYEAAAPIADRVIGLVRVGKRRWDVVLDRDQRILLPEEDAVTALERVIALGHSQDMLARDLVAVDMRIAERPTIRIAERAMEEWWRIRQTPVEKREE